MTQRDSFEKKFKPFCDMSTDENRFSMYYVNPHVQLLWNGWQTGQSALKAEIVEKLERELIGISSLNDDNFNKAIEIVRRAGE